MNMTTKNYLTTTLIAAALAANLAQTWAAPAQTKKPAPKKPAATKPTTLKAKPNYIVGRVTNRAGQPIGGVEIGIYGTTIAGANVRFEAATNAQGMFSQRLPEGIYGASAYLKKRFNNKNYKFTLPPTDGVTSVKHDSSLGIVKNFVWKISGLRPGETPGKTGAHTEPAKYFGGFIYLKSKVVGFGGDRIYFPSGSTLEVTMTPRGPLIDGSKGQVKTFRRRFEQDVTSGIDWHLADIPIGTYTLSAQLLASDATQKPLNVRNLTATGVKEEFFPTVAIDFEPTQFDDMQMMQVMIEP